MIVHVMVGPSDDLLAAEVFGLARRALLGNAPRMQLLVVIKRCP